MASNHSSPKPKNTIELNIMLVRGKNKLQSHNQTDARTNFDKDLWKAQAETMGKVHSLVKKAIKIRIEEELPT